MLNAPTTFRFSLQAVPQPQRREVAMEVLSTSLCRLDLTAHDGALEMEVQSRMLPGITVTETRLSPHRGITHLDGPQKTHDFVLIWSASPGKGCVTQLGKEFNASGGQAVLFSSQEQIAWETGEAFPFISVKIQRSALHALLPNAETGFLRPISPNNEALRLLNAYLSGLRLLGDADGGAAFAHATATHIADLVALAVGTNRDGTQLAAQRGLRAARLDAVKRWVLTQLGSPDLNINTAATAVGLSPRSVQMLFELEGTTFTSYVLRGRLALAHHRLSMPQPEKPTVSEIVYHCGFGDLSYFASIFRKVYGEAPSDVRRRAIAEFDQWHEQAQAGMASDRHTRTGDSLQAPRLNKAIQRIGALPQPNPILLKKPERQARPRRTAQRALT